MCQDVYQHINRFFKKKKVVHMHSGILLSCEENDIMIFANSEWNWKLLR